MREDLATRILDHLYCRIENKFLLTYIIHLFMKLDKVVFAMSSIICGIILNFLYFERNEF